MNTQLEKPVLLYDGDCGFCRTWVDYWRQLTGEAVTYRPYQQACDDYDQVDYESCESAVQFIDTDGSAKSAAAAAFAVLAIGGQKKWHRLYEYVPGFAALAEFIYRIVANNRSLFHSLTKFFFGTPVRPSRFVFSTWLFVKSIGGVYLFAFLSFWMQADGLIGSSGILPVEDFVSRMHSVLGSEWVWQNPTLFGVVAGDWMITLVAVLGVAFATALITGVLPRVSLIALFLLYLSIVNAGQIFFSYQWDVLLLEAGFLAIFISPQSNIVVYLLWWLLARLMFSSGLVKLLSGDASWRNLSALSYHYYTQPLPTAFGYFFDKLPGWFHRLSVLGMFAIEFGAAVMLFFGRKIRMAAGAAIAGLQVLIGLVGNYTFFNLLGVILAIPLFDDAFWRRVSGDFAKKVIRGVEQYGLGWPVQKLSFPFNASVAFWTGIVVLVVYGMLNVAHFWVAVEQEKETPPVVRSTVSLAQPLHLVNSYGLFAVMTKKRPEIILEGSRDGDKWKKYDFKYKPDHLGEAPSWAQPHQPRLDWQLWFAALRGNPQQNRWFMQFVRRLLEGSPAVEQLLADVPFERQPPKYIRARIFNYRFSEFDSLLKDGRWWQRQQGEIFLPPVSLR